MPSNACGRFGAQSRLLGAQGGDAAEPCVASSAAHALRKVRTASADLGAFIGHWRQGPSSSQRAACLDDATNATLAPLCGSLASLQEVVHDCMNDQTRTTQGGDGEVVIAWAAVARDGGRNAGKDMAP